VPAFPGCVGKRALSGCLSVRLSVVAVTADSAFTRQCCEVNTGSCHVAVLSDWLSDVTLGCVYLLTMHVCMCCRASCQNEWFLSVQWWTWSKTSR